MHDFFLRLLRPIVSRQEALLVIRDASRVCYVVAALDLLAGLILGWGVLVDGIIFATLGYWLRRSHSRVAAALLIIQSLVSLVFTVLAHLRIVSGGRNLFLASVVGLVALRAWDATNRLASLARRVEETAIH